MRRRTVLAGAIAASAFAAAGRAAALASPETRAGAAAGAAPAFSASTSSDEAFLHIQVAMSELSERAQADAKIDAATVSSLQGQVNELEDLFGHDSGRRDEYVSALDLIANVLAATAQTADPAQANEKLAQVRDDLEVKVRSARASLHAFGSRPSLIEVVITTVRRAVPVSGYLVACSPALLGAGAPPMYPFNDPSNPDTRRRLTPGKYLLFASLNGRRVATQDVEISLRDGPNAPISLQVP